MTRIERTALIAQPPSKMFALVDDVTAYPRLFPWCEKSEVLAEDGEFKTARLHLKLGALRTSFATRNRRMEPSSIAMQLVEGPFKQLSGEWRFAPIGEVGCKVSLVLEFETDNRLLGPLFARGFKVLADRMVDDFVRAAATA
ncbi:MAG: SRPBCC family protein [Lysobacteraceae bacterium]